MNDDQVPHGRHTELELAQGPRAASLRRSRKTAFWLGAWVRIGREVNNYAKSIFHVPFSHFRWMESQTSV